MIQLLQEDYINILHHLRSEAPVVGCGLLAGVTDEGVCHIKCIYPMENADGSPDHFSFHPREMMGVIKDLRSRGLHLAGNFHCHTTSPADPSAEDIRLASDPSMYYLIISLQNPQSPELKAFRIINGHVSGVPVEIK